MLMISAMFMIASCGSNSNSNEASSEEKTEESVEEVEFSNPAIVIGKGVDLTSYFSPVSVSQPTIYTAQNTDNRLSVNVKLKVTKKINLQSSYKNKFGADYAEAEEFIKNSHQPTIIFDVKFCDKSGSKIEDSKYSYDHEYKLEDLSEGTTISLDFLGANTDLFESDAQSKLSKVKYIEVSISTKDAELANE